MSWGAECGARWARWAQFGWRLCAGLWIGWAGLAAAQDGGVAELERPSAEWPAPSPLGRAALALRPEKWRYAETPHFALHFRRLTEARKVAREAEFHLQFVSKELGFDPARDGAGRSRVYLFEDEEEWRAFLAGAGQDDWMASFAYGEELFLNVRRSGGDRDFRAGLLAHELTHAVVARFYPGKRWPLWLNEGLAEYMAAASVAERKNQSVKRHLGPLPLATWRVEALEGQPFYPADPRERAAFYQSAEKTVRFLMRELPPERFRRFLDEVLEGRHFAEALLSVYGDKIRSMEAFEGRYADFEK